MLLYINKIRSFANYRNKQECNNDPNKLKNIKVVIDRIKIILHKIVTLTLFYQIAITICGIVAYFINYAKDIVVIKWIYRNIVACCWAILSLVQSLSMYLMMEHNKEEYIKFLKLIKCMKLDWICCKWRNVVGYQLDEFRNQVKDDET